MASPCPRSSASLPGYAPGVSMKVMMGRPNFSACFIRRRALRYPSGGALALGVANHILMLENAVYSVLSPEGFASILWKDASRSGEACEMMKLTAQDLYRDGIVEEVIPEPLGGAQRGHAALFEHLDTALRNHLRELCRMNGRQLADQRYKKYRQIGETRNA